MDLVSIRRALTDCPCGRRHETELPRVAIGPDITQKTAQILLAECFGQRLHLVGDRNTLAAAPSLREALLSAGFILSETVFDDMYSADMPAAEQIIRDATEAEGILAVGSGSVNDLCKLAAFRLGLPYAIFASAPSMDGFLSKDAAIIQDGFKGSYEARAPRLVLGDTRVLAEAPVRLKASGFGDLIGKYTALADWEIAHLVTGEYFCPRLAQLTRDGVDRAVALADQIAGPDEQAAGALMEALVLSGIAMLQCGNSRPASGAEHHLSHFWEMLALRQGEIPDLHGRKVGVASILITRHYKQLAQQKLINPAHCLLPEKEILSVYGDSAAGVLTENTPDPLGAVDLRRFKACWPGIRRIVAGLPGEQELTGLIRRAGGACLPEQVHVSQEQAQSALRFGRYTRRRLTLLRLSDLLR